MAENKTMRNYDSEMYNFVRLAKIAHDKQQQIGCVKFLILTGVAACRAGYFDVAELCYQLVATKNKRHLLLEHATLSEALQSEEFQPFVKQLERFCSYEKSEYLLERAEVENVHLMEEDTQWNRETLVILEEMSA